MEGLYRRIITIYRPLIQSLNELLGEHELSYALWEVIYYLKKHGASTLVEISLYYRVEKPAITRRVYRLQELELIDQIPSKDRREKLVQLSSSGEELYQLYRKKITASEGSALKNIPEEDIDVLFRTLLQIRKNLIAKEGEKLE